MPPKIYAAFGLMSGQRKRTAQWEKSAIFFLSAGLTFLNFVIYFLPHQRPFQSIWLIKHFLIYLCLCDFFIYVICWRLQRRYTKPSPVKSAWIFIGPFKSPPSLGCYVFSSIITVLLSAFCICKSLGVHGSCFSLFLTQGQCYQQDC